MFSVTIDATVWCQKLFFYLDSRLCEKKKATKFLSGSAKTKIFIPICRFIACCDKHLLKCHNNKARLLSQCALKFMMTENFIKRQKILKAFTITEHFFSIIFFWNLLQKSNFLQLTFSQLLFLSCKFHRLSASSISPGNMKM